MKNYNLKLYIEELLQNTKFSDKNNNIFTSKILEAIEKIDQDLVKILINDRTAKKLFFTKVLDTYVMNQFKLIDFFSMNNYFEKSYTSYTNKIGLIRKDDFIKNNNDVVLAFPYKDSVLEGGQTKEDKKSKENFFNEILDADEIDRIFEPKVLTNIKKYSKNTVQKNPTITDKDNLILKGNNLLALHSLKKKYANKIKLIYIDPPYNTGNDSFKYNDRFNHSTWLTFMKNRLEIAKELLRDDGVIFIQCDDNEQAYLKVLMDEIFGINNFIGDLIRKTKSTTNDAKVGFNIQHENTLIFANDKSKVFLTGKPKTFENYKNPDNDPNGDWISDNPSAKSGNYYFKITNPYTGQVDLPPENSHWRFSEKRLQDYIDSGKIKFKKNNKPNERGFIFKRYKNEIKSDFNLLGSLEATSNEYMNQVATKERNKLFGEVDFSYPKPEFFLELIIRSSTTYNDLVLDFFIGSGTTSAVAHKMARQYIGIEQMDYIQDITIERMKKVINGEQGGISKSVNWHGGGNFVYAELKQVSNFDKSHSKLKQEMRYLPIGEIEDEDYKISKEEIAINKAFYGIDNE